jgi:hypothetical protein
VVQLFSYYPHPFILCDADRECAATILDAFQKAADPSRIYVGAVTYTKPDNYTDAELCKSPALAPYEARIKRQNVYYLDAEGPTVTRLAAANLIGQQEYFLNVRGLLWGPRISTVT